MKQEKYSTLYEQIKSLTEGEDDLTANLANISSIIHYTFNFWWTGFYIVKGRQLVLGPFQGPLACTRIPYGKGVCGTSWARRETIVVEDVHKFEGHIACSSASLSEIVVPIFKDEEVVAVLDVDSEKLATFDSTDRQWLEKIVGLIKF